MQQSKVKGSRVPSCNQVVVCLKHGIGKYCLEPFATSSEIADKMMRGKRLSYTILNIGCLLAYVFVYFHGVVALELELPGVIRAVVLSRQPARLPALASFMP